MRKTRFHHFTTILLFFAILITAGCRKDSMPPIVETDDVTDITSNSARCGGVIVSDNGADITETGLCWSTYPTPSVGDHKVVLTPENGNFSCNLTGLIPFSTYFIRAYAVNKQGTSYGETKIFCTKQIPAETVTDIDGNLYHTVTIGTQVWMLENLRTTRFRNGDSIKYTSIYSDWFTAIPQFCYYNNDITNAATYGYLYNWFAAADSRGLAPAGWHVPTQEDWLKLLDYCGGPDIAAGKLKSTGFSNWASPNYGATNQTGFSALPAGARGYDGTFSGKSVYCSFWSSSEYITTMAYYADMQYNTAQVTNYWGYKYNGHSIRCIKD